MVRFNLNCQLCRIWNHVEGIPLGVSVVCLQRGVTERWKGSTLRVGGISQQVAKEETALSVP